MLLLEESNNYLSLSLEGYDDTIILKDYSDDKIKEIYNIYNKKILNLKKKYKELFGVEDLSNEEELKVSINFDNINNYDLLLDFLNKVKSVRIIISSQDNKDFDSFISSLNEDGLDNVFIKYQFSSDEASLKDYKSMMSKINGLINTIKGFNLSELETVMVVYDIVKSYKYGELSIEDPSLSRSLHNVLMNDSCVCAGFSNYFNYLLNELGINSKPIILGYNNILSKHQRSIMYVKDKKYGVSGIYMFDPTFDCKRNDNYANNYDYFLQSVEYFNKVFKDEYIQTDWIGNYDIYNLLSMEDIDNLSFIESANISRGISYLYRLMGRDSDFISLLNTENSKKKLKRVKYELSKEVDYRIFVKLLYKVKQVEQEMGLIKEYSNEEIVKTSFKRYINMGNRLNDKERLFDYMIGFKLYDFNSIFNDKDNIKKKEYAIEE